MLFSTLCLVIRVMRRASTNPHLYLLTAAAKMMSNAEYNFATAKEHIDGDRVKGSGTGQPAQASLIVPKPKVVFSVRQGRSE